MYFSKQPPPACGKSTKAQLDTSAFPIAKPRSTKRTDRKAHTRGARPLPYFEDFYGRANPDEVLKADYCESESDEDNETESGKKRKRNTDYGERQYEKLNFDSRDYGNRITGCDERQSKRRKLDLEENGKRITGCDERQHKRRRLDLEANGKRITGCDERQHKRRKFELQENGKRITGCDERQHKRTKFDLEENGRRTSCASSSDEEEGETLSRDRKAANLHDIGVRYQKALHHLNNHAQQKVNTKQPTERGPDQSEKNSPYLYHNRARESASSSTSTSSTSSTASAQSAECSQGKEPHNLKRSAERRLLSPFDMPSKSTNQAHKPGSVKREKNNPCGKNTQSKASMDDFGDDLGDINEDYRLLETSTAMMRLRDLQVPVVKVEVDQKQKANKESMVPRKSEGVASGQGRYSTRGAELAAQREREEQRLANRRVTRHAAAQASSTPTKKLKSKAYGRGDMTARSAVLKTSKRTHKKKAKPLPLLGARGGKRSMRNWKGELLKLKPGQLIPIVSIKASRGGE